MSNAWSSRRGRRRVAVTPPESCIYCTDRDSERLSSPQTTRRSLMVQVLFLCRSPRIIPSSPHPVQYHQHDPPLPQYDTLTPLLLQKSLTIICAFTYFLRTKISTCCSTPPPILTPTPLQPPLSALWIRDALGQDRHKGAPSARLWGRCPPSLSEKIQWCLICLVCFFGAGGGVICTWFFFFLQMVCFASTCLSSSSSSRYDGNLRWTGICQTRRRSACACNDLGGGG